VVIQCPLCGVSLGEAAADGPERVESSCPGCGAALVLRRIEETARDGDLGTMFQARIEVESVEPTGAETLTARAAPGDDRASSGAPEIPPGPEAFFMVLGAPAGQERIRLERARTVFGRAGADVELADGSVAERHFQVEVMGREFFLRDLGSGRGTRLNGSEVRYTELLPGDEVAAGATVLVFRTADDGVSRRRP